MDNIGSGIVIGITIATALSVFRFFALYYTMKDRWSWNKYTFRMKIKEVLNTMVHI